MKPSIHDAGHGRRGMTLVELVVAISIFGIVITTAVAFAAKQNTAFQNALLRLNALRNLRYAVTTLGQDLETLGTNVPQAQPTLIYGGNDVITFSADYASNVANDPFAVFYDADAPNGQVRAPTGPFTIPLTGFSAADSSYLEQPGVSSPAEIMTFYLTSDSSTSRTDDYVLYRQVNGNPPEALARNLLHMGTRPFFSYMRETQDSAGASMVAPVADSLVPLHHSAAIHLSAADTGRSAMADSVRAVRIAMAATNGLTGQHERTVELSRLIPLPNSGFGVLSTCGSPPLLGTNLQAQAVTLGGGEPAVKLTWNPAIDETGGEADVVRYVLWRRIQGTPGWGDPYLAIPAGQPNYTYQDATVESGQTYEFALAAQDCTPSLSPLAASAPVTIP
jgi:prepilin-type N-terminal cleavage/methylation domain-containing protein